MVIEGKNSLLVVLNGAGGIHRLHYHQVDLSPLKLVEGILLIARDPNKGDLHTQCTPIVLDILSV